MNRIENLAHIPTNHQIIVNRQCSFGTSSVFRCFNLSTMQQFPLILFSILLTVLCLGVVDCFAPPVSFLLSRSTSTNHPHPAVMSHNMADGITTNQGFDVITAATMTTGDSISSSLSSLLASSSSSIYLAETEAWVQPTALILDPLLNFLSFAMLARVVLSWYPETKISEMPWVVVAIPTEPLLRAVKGVVPPAFGVDITPVFWLAIFTFIHEILLGQQGLLTLKIKYGI